MKASFLSRWLLGAVITVASVLLSVPASAQEKATKQTEEAKKAAADWSALFKMHWQNRVKSFKEQNHVWQNVVLVGDSITEGFDVVKHFPGRRMVNRGIGEDVIGNDMAKDDPRGVLQRLDNSIFDCAPTDVFLLIGINDLNSGRKVEQMEKGYRELLQRIREKRPDLRIYVQSVLPTRGAHEKQNEPVRQFNAKLKVLAEEFKCSFIDLHVLMIDAEGKLKAEFTNDGLHLNDEAYAVWKQTIETTLKWR